MTGTGGHTPQDSVERALAAARCDDCVVIAEESSTANLRWAGNTLTTNGIAQARRLTVVAIQRQGEAANVGVVSRIGAREEQIEELVRAAEAAAAQSSPAEDAKPLLGPDSPGVCTGTGGASWDDPAQYTEIGVFRAFTTALGGAFDQAAARDQKLYGYAEHDLTSTFLGTSSGLRLRHDQPAGKVELNAKSADLSRSTWSGVATRDFTDVDVTAMNDQLARRIEWGGRRVELPAGRYETLLPPGAMADLLTYMYWHTGARDALDGRTVFSKAGGGTRIGEQLTGLPVTLRGDPREAGLECAPFVVAHVSRRDASVFDNGLALQRSDWISEGRLTALQQTRYSAELSGQPVTPGIGNLIFESSRDSLPTLEDMIAATQRGLLITCLWYVREVDPQTLLLTGLTRDGVYLVENGEVTAEVNNFRFNETPVGMLSRLAEVGRSAPTLPRELNDYFSRVAMPPGRVMDFNMSSVSQAS